MKYVKNRFFETAQKLFSGNLLRDAVVRPPERTLPVIRGRFFGPLYD